MFDGSVPQPAPDPDVQITIDTLLNKAQTQLIEEISLRIELKKSQGRVEQLENILKEMKAKESEKLSAMVAENRLKMEQVN